MNYEMDQKWSHFFYHFFRSKFEIRYMYVYIYLFQFISKHQKVATKQQPSRHIYEHYELLSVTFSHNIRKYLLQNKSESPQKQQQQQQNKQHKQQHNSNSNYLRTLRATTIILFKRREKKKKISKEAILNVCVWSHIGANTNGLVIFHKRKSWK